MTQSLTNPSQLGFKPTSPYRPLCAGHRGYKGRFPENTFESMRRAVEAGADIIETDVQVAGDGIVVVTHDPNTVRCFGKNYDVTKTPYTGVLEHLRPLPSHSMTLSDPLPTFDNLIEMLTTEPAMKKAKLMLDIKRTNEPWIIPQIFQTLLKYNSDVHYWADRMCLGIWRLDVLLEAEKTCPVLPVIHIGISQILARRFLKHEQVIGISLIAATLHVSGGKELIRDTHAQNKLVYSWTINTIEYMKWAVASKLDGIVTDFPDRYHEFINGVTEKDIAQTYSVVSPTSFHPLVAKIHIRVLYLIMWMYAFVLEVRFLLTPSRKSPY